MAAQILDSIRFLNPFQTFLDLKRIEHALPFLLLDKRFKRNWGFHGTKRLEKSRHFLLVYIVVCPFDYVEEFRERNQTRLILVYCINHRVQLLDVSCESQTDHYFK